jgi:hypothetical protein
VRKNFEAEHDNWGQGHSEQIWPAVEQLEWPLAAERMLQSEEDYDRLYQSFRARRTE